MTKPQIQLAWKKIISETHKRSLLDGRLKEKNISQAGELLLYTQVLLDEIENGENIAFNKNVYAKTMSFYRAQMKKYV